jgi:hypothetical protein
METLGITSLSRSQVSRMAADLDAQVEAFRTRPLDQGPYTFVAADAVREGARVENVHALVATGVNADGHRGVLGLQVTTGQDGAGWLAVLPRPDRPRPDRRSPGHLRRERRTRSRDRRHHPRAPFGDAAGPSSPPT